MARIFRNFALVVVSLLWCSPALSAPQHREAMTIRGNVNADSARVLFMCKQPVGFTPTLKDKTLTVTFDRTFTANMKAILASHKTYFSAAALNATGTVITFTLKKPLSHFRRFVGDNFVGLDLFPTEEKASKDVPKKEAAAPPPVEEVNQAALLGIVDPYKALRPLAASLSPGKEGFAVQAEQHAGNIDTITFAWDRAVAATVFKRADRLWVVFDRNATVPLDQITRALPTLSDGKQIPNRLYTLLSFKMPENDARTLRSFKQGNNWVVAFVPGKPPAPTAVEASFNYSYGRGSLMTLPVTDITTPVKFIDPVVGDELLVTPIYAEGKFIGQNRQFIDFDLLGTAEGFAVALHSDNVRWQQIAQGLELNVPHARITVGGAERALVEEGTSTEEPYAKPAPTPAPATEEAAKPAISADESLFDFRSWKLLPDDSFFVNTEDELEAAINHAEPKDVSADRLKLAHFYFAQGLYAETLGVLHIIKQDDPAYAKTNPVMLLEGATLYLLNRFTEAAATFTALDFTQYSDLQLEEVRLWRVATDMKLQEYVRMQSKASIAGQDNSTPLTEEEQRNSNNLHTARRILDMSNLLLGMIQDSNADFSERPEVKELQSVATVLNDHYEQTVKELDKTDFAAVDEQKLETIKQNMESMDSAKRILDTSLTLLGLIKQSDPEFSKQKEVRLLESTAAFVVKHYTDTLKTFDTSYFDKLKKKEGAEQVEAEEHSLASLMLQGQNIQMDYVGNSTGFLQGYPLSIRRDFAILSAKQKIALSQYDKAEEVLNIFSGHGSSVGEEPNVTALAVSDDAKDQPDSEIKYLLGEVALGQGDEEKATKLWEEVSQDVFDRQSRANASLQLTELRLKDGKITPADAVKTLDRLRIVWRGDVFELSLLKRLGQLFIEQNDYMRGLKAWRELVTIFPGTEDALFVAQQMSKTFVYLFNEGGAKNMTPLTALAIYYEFRELTPIGSLGDKMIQSLAQYLIDVDLLDRAAALLTHQIRYRLTGEDRIRVAAKLAEVHLLSQKPELALDVLDTTEGGNISPELTEERRLLRAKALIALNRGKEALALLAKDTEKTAFNIKLDYYWNEGDLAVVRDMLADKFEERLYENRKLSSDELRDLLRLALVYSAEHDSEELDYLQEEASRLLPDDPGFKELFTFVTSQTGPIDYNHFDNTAGYEKFKDLFDSFNKVVGKVEAVSETPSVVGTGTSENKP